MRTMFFAILISCLSGICSAAETVAGLSIEESTSANTLRHKEPPNEPLWPTLLCLSLGIGSLVLVRRNIEGCKTRRTAEAISVLSG